MKMDEDRCYECTDYEDRCYECTGYGDDYYYDEEIEDYVKACNDCPYNERWEDE